MQPSMISDAKEKELRTSASESPAVVRVIIDGLSHAGLSGERLLDLINRVTGKLPQVCYHPQLEPVRACDACLVEINGQPARACEVTICDEMRVSTLSFRAHGARHETLECLERVTAGKIYVY